MGFDERLEKSPSFRAMVENTETNARAGYNIALADVYNVNSLDALSYLMLANAAYSNAGEPSYAHAKDETGINDPLKQKVEMSDSRLISPSTEYGCLGEIVTDSLLAATLPQLLGVAAPSATAFSNSTARKSSRKRASVRPSSVRKAAMCDIHAELQARLRQSPSPRLGEKR